MKIMQKLSKRNTYTPRDTSLVSSNCDLLLNKDESLSVIDLKTLDNNPEGNALQHTEDQNLRVFDNVYVLSMRGNPLMPTTPTQARRLLKCKRANIINRRPFVIQLLYATGETKQEITLGIDSGYKNIGFSAITEKKELLSGTMILENNMSSRLTEKRMYRRSRRNRLWYRKPRFLNRGIKKGWLPPSIERRYETHLNLIKRIKNIIPVDRINIECGSFDIQKINNSDISGIDYQQGSLYNYNNIKSYLLSREKGKCQICGKEKGTDKFVVHHIIQKKDGGTDKVNNLALLHDKCHKLFHVGKNKLTFKKHKQYKEATFMSIIRNKFIKEIDCNICFGYETRTKRIELEIDKSHANDAFVIAGGSNQNRNKEYVICQKKRNNRCLQVNRKGFKPSIRKQKYKYQPKDIVVIDGKSVGVVGAHNCGTRVMVKELFKNKSYSVKKIEQHYINNGWIFTKGFLPCLKAGVSD